MAKKKAKKPAAPPAPRTPDAIRQEWANTAAALGDKVHVQRITLRQHDQATRDAEELHTKLDELDAEFRLASEFYSRPENQPQKQGSNAPA